MAEQLASNGHPRQATVALNKAWAILAALPEEAQKEARCQYLRASCDHLRAKWQRSSGHYMEAEHMLERTFSVLNRLHTEDPSNREYRYGIAGCENERALILSATGRERAARDAFRHALHVLRGLKSENPEMPWIALPLAQISNNYANLLQAAAVRRAHSAAARLAATAGAAASATGYASLGCAICLAHDQAMQNQDIRDAFQLYADGIDLLQDLTGKFALHPTPRYEVALAWNNLGRLRALTGQNEEARKAYLASVVHLEQLIIVFPKSKDYQMVLAGVQHNLAELSVPPQSPHSR